MRLTFKISAVLCLVLVAMFCGGSWLIYHFEDRNLDSVQDAYVQASLKSVAYQCGSALGQGSENECLRTLYLLTVTPHQAFSFAFIIDLESRVLVHSNFLRKEYALKGAAVRKAGLQTALDHPAGVAVQRNAVGGLRIYSAPVTAENARIGTLVCAYTEQGLRGARGWAGGDARRRLFQSLFAGLGLGLLVSAGLVIYFLSPLQELVAASRKVAVGNFRARMPEDRADELGDLAREFNLMSQRLGELDELKESFLAKITHDLRNPLAAIVGYVEMLLMGMHGPLTGKQSESLRIISENSGYLGDLINNILDLTKLEAGKMDFSPKKIGLHESVISVVELMRVKADEYKVALDYSSVPEGHTVWADEQGLKRVLLNLVSNALKFTPSGGSVFLEWTAEASGDDRIAVRDTGIGIPKERLNSLFQKFSQVRETQNKVREARGTGLGLAIAKEIVEGHGGRIWVESEYQHGTTFFFALPLVPAIRGVLVPKQSERA